MKIFRKKALNGAIAIALLGMMGSAGAVVNIQCPGDIDGDAAWNSPGETQPANTQCMSLIAGDSFAIMSDTNPMYIFGFGDQTGTPTGDLIAEGILDAE